MNTPRILEYIPSNFIVNEVSDKHIVCSIESDCLSNGNVISKKIIFHENGTWELSIGGKTVNLETVHVDNTYFVDKDSIGIVCTIVEKLQMCEGVVVNTSVIISRFHTLEQFQKNSTTPSVRTVKSISCNRVIDFGAHSSTCRICQNMTFSSSDTIKESINLNPSTANDDENVERIKHLLKHANPELVNLFIEQSKNVSRDPRGRRWSKYFIGTCLQLYNRSPHSYELLIYSKMLVLPSPSTLIMYKNKLKQDPGFDHSMFEWMLDEAKRRDIPEDGMVGGLIFDEMSIQSDIQINKNGDIVELAGFTDIGVEGDLCHTLRKGKPDKQLGTHVLQLLFLSITGFRFPFAHFITDNVQASELYGLFWKAVELLWTYGFKVLYTCMDGAVCNRSFMHICVGDNSYLNYKFLSLNPCISQQVIFMMDVSHVLKKIRNNTMKSGITKKSTRNLTLPSGFTVQWQMFIDCYKWDQQNSLQLHRKLTNDHIFPDSQMKMRNYLAEDVLNSEMLHLMRQYQNYLGEKGQVLNGVIEMLENTSQIVSIFRDMRPIKISTDPRLSTLKGVSNWFLQWERCVYEDKILSKKDMGKRLMSSQCHEDVQACVLGFISLCESVLKMTRNIYITPALINSDVIENIFNQQRSTYNGANTNPTALQYRKTINSIVVGQNTVSKKSNAGKPVSSAVPFTVEMKKPVRKRRSVQPSSAGSNIKVIKM